MPDEDESAFLREKWNSAAHILQKKCEGLKSTIIGTLQLRGQLSGWVTQIATNLKYPNMILSSSRDRTLIVWKLTRDDASYGIPQKRLRPAASKTIPRTDVRFSPNHSNPIIVSAGWDLTVGLESGQLQAEDRPTVPCACLSKDCKAFLWDLNDNKHLHTLEQHSALLLGAVRHLRIVDQDLRSGLQDHGQGAEAVEGRLAAVAVAGLVHRRTDPDAGYFDNIIRV
ncbi:hypothetical protein pipiens_004116 [Culex pipiens pipiens]|uniref:Small ribosomal subunit protein RACK1 n=1 Tax=Culex pipiens pipiens TaxID=38569 RepID=A0ABD1CNJ5_CULPP